MDACAGNVTDVCKMGQELLTSVRNFSQCSVSCKNGGVTFDSEPLPAPEKIAAVWNTTKIQQWVLQLPVCLNANEQSAIMGESLVGELPAPISPYTNHLSIGTQ